MVGSREDFYQWCTSHPSPQSSISSENLGNGPVYIPQKEKGKLEIFNDHIGVVLYG